MCRWYMRWITRRKKIFCFKLLMFIPNFVTACNTHSLHYTNHMLSTKKKKVSNQSVKKVGIMVLMATALPKPHFSYELYGKEWKKGREKHHPNSWKCSLTLMFLHRQLSELDILLSVSSFLWDVRLLPAKLWYHVVHWAGTSCITVEHNLIYL